MPTKNCIEPDELIVASNKRFYATVVENHGQLLCVDILEEMILILLHDELSGHIWHSMSLVGLSSNGCIWIFMIFIEFVKH